jgi:TatD DNase family protein
VVRNAFLELNKLQLEKLPYSVSIGLHPWHLLKKTIDNCIDELTISALSKNVLAIGEIGIDRAIETPVKTQIAYFEAQLYLAEQLQKPIIIHAVKSYSDFIPYLKKAKVPFVFHQFNGNVQQANELLKYNCKLSFGKNIFNHTQIDLLKHIPLDSFFLETDTAHHINIFDIYTKASEIKGVKMDALKEQLFFTFAQVFKTA